MSDHKHTPGPWTVPHFADDTTECDCPFVLSEYQRGAGAIATVHWDGEEGLNPEDQESAETARANAHLIATAPDLRDELENAAVELEWAGREFDITACKLRARESRRILALADGKEEA